MEKKIIPNDLLLGEVSRLVAEGEKVTIMTKGVSMLPFIRGERDSVLLQRPENLAPGMIVLAYVENRRYVLHRIMSMEGDKVTLMGDGNIAGVERCRIEDVKAVAVKIITPKGEIDCMSRKHLRRAAIWKSLLPVRRWILAIYRRLFI